jgi:hypothetical protein
MRLLHGTVVALLAGDREHCGQRFQLRRPSIRAGMERI